MAINLGKRKRNERIDKSKSDLVSETEEDSSDAERDVQAVFRRVFEARFQPLEDNHKIHKDSKSIDLVEEQQDSETDWEGIDSEDDKETVQIIEYSDFQGGEDGDDLSKREMKAFMSSKPPTTTNKNTTLPNRPTADSDSDAETANLKNDLALQRLLRESHLLDASSASLTPHQGNRPKALDLRLASLGAKSSALSQDNMPMAQRKGIAAKARQREDKRRREAQENGVILAKTHKAGEKKGGKRRERGVGAPGVGMFRGGTLQLSRRDVANIHGAGGGGGRRHKG